MTVVKMPDGTDVDFGDLPPDQIRSLIREKFPDVVGGSAGGATPANAATSAAPPAEERGSLMDPVMQGVTFGFADELAGLFGGAADWMGFGPKGSEGTFSEGYDRTAAKARGNLRAYEERQPVASLAGEVGGALATLPVTGAMNVIRAPAAVAKTAPVAARAANALGRGAAATANSAATGAAYGAAYGAGTADGDIGDRLGGAVEGGMFGGAVGAAAPAVTGALGWAGRKVGDVLGNPIKTGKGAIAPASEAQRRVVGAIEADVGGKGGVPKALRMLDEAAADNVPLTALDVGETTRALGRSAANTSPAGRDALNQMVDKRFVSQIDRATDIVERNAPGIQSNATRDLLKQAAKRANKPLYDRAYLEGEKGIWHEGLEQLTYAPVMRDAIRKASTTGANKAAAEGVRPPRNPFIENADGTLSMKKDVLPNLRFWDAVKQNLDDDYDRLIRSGDKGAAGDILSLKKQLVSYLDEAAPTYAKARGSAANFFGADDAITAGEEFVKWRGRNAEARSIVDGLKPAERTLFAEGFATKLIADLNEVGERRSIITSKIFNSPAAKERLEIALGPKAAKEMEAFLYIEDVMDLGRKAVQGNSTTARQLAELGLAGGAGLVVGGGDLSNPNTYITALLTGAMLHAGRSGLKSVDEKVAREVADLLASQNPQSVKDAVQRVSRNPKLMEAFGRAHERLTRALLPSMPKGGAQPAAADGDGN